jgi:lipoate-protein ligase A
MLHLLESPPRAEDNLALDNAWFQSLEAGAGADALHLWESPVPVVVLGRSNTLLEVKSEACAADGVAILRRESGGGAVLLGPGCICYSLLLSFDRHPTLRDVRLSYSRILGRLIDALAVPGLSIRGLSDLALVERKVSGNAQRRGGARAAPSRYFAPCIRCQPGGKVPAGTMPPAGLPFWPPARGFSGQSSFIGGGDRGAFAETVVIFDKRSRNTVKC